MPFITEEIWSNLRQKITFPQVIDSEFLMTARFPVADNSFLNDKAEKQFELTMDVITALRTIRAENNVPPDKQGNAVIIPSDSDSTEVLRSQLKLINQFARLTETIIDQNATKPSFSGSSVVRGTSVYLSLEGLIDIKVEIERLTKEISRVSNLISGARARLENQNFISRAPEDVIAKEREKLQGLEENLEKLEKNLQMMQKSDAV
jgi:valyl-tRNA synthetase